MTICRENPLPVGDYWQDLTGEKHQALWHAWVKGLNRDRENLRILTTEDHEASSGVPPWTWVKFRVLHPVLWDHEMIASPTIATDAIQTADDTVMKPPPPKPPEEKLDEFLGNMETFGLVIGGCVVVATVAYVAFRKKR